MGVGQQGRSPLYHRPPTEVLANGYYPKSWRKAIAIAIPKSGKPDYSNPRAYRLIPLLECLAKVLKRIVANLAGKFNLVPSNLTKRERMHYSRRKNYNCSPPITLHDFDGNTRTIATDKTTRWLGVHFDRKFLFNHVKMLAARGFIAVNLLYMLANTVRGLSHASLRRLYLSAISPKLLYACPTWWNDKKCQAKLLDKVQRRALIICTCFNRLS